MGGLKKINPCILRRVIDAPLSLFLKTKKQYMHGILRALQVPAVHEKETSETQ